MARVSVVDDDASIRRALTRLLSAAGYDVATFASAEAFLAAMVNDAPDCAIVDVRLPGISGLELQERLAAAGQSIPIVFITAHVDGRVREEAHRSNAADFLYKPFDDRTLLGAVQRAVQSANCRREE